jgi:hypothetical protein
LGIVSTYSPLSVRKPFSRNPVRYKIIVGESTFNGSGANGMRSFRFHIGSLVILILIIGVGFAALRESSDLWENGVFTLAIGVLLTSILFAFHRIERRRALWIGFALFGWVYLGLSVVPSIESRMMTTKLLAFLDAQVPGRSIVTNAAAWTLAVQAGKLSGTLPAVWSGTSDNFVRIGHSLVALLAAWLGGELSGRLYRSWRSQEPTTSPQLKPKVTAADPHTLHNRFGGEGTGAHTHMIWDWSLGETFQFFVEKAPGKTPDTTDTRYYICDRSSKKWRHSATITNPNGGKMSVTTIGGGLNSFLENFSGRDRTSPKLALYRLWLGSSLDTMKYITKAVGDGKWGELHDSYFLAEGSNANLTDLFAKLKGQYGEPIMGVKGTTLEPISDIPLEKKLIDTLKQLPRAKEVDDK